jgi:integrase
VTDTRFEALYAVAAKLGLRQGELAALPKMRFHDLQHTAATLVLKNGVDVGTMADILGHKDPAMTLRRYGWVLPSYP